MNSQIGKGRKQWMVKVLEPLLDREFLSILEIGSWEGESTKLWASMTNAPILCVDAWQPLYKPEREPLKGTRDRFLQMNETCERAFMTFQSNMKPYLNVTWLRGKTEDVLPMITIRFDFIFVDGSHYFADVCNDLEWCQKLVKPGGRIAGDDLEVQYNDLTGAELEVTYKKLHCDYVKFKHRRWHPGVTMAVHEVLGKVEAHNGIWWIDHPV